MKDVIDLNEVWKAPARFDLDAIRDWLSATAADWLPQLFPQARLARDRRSLRCADLSGRAPRNEGSLHIGRGAECSRDVEVSAVRVAAGVEVCLFVVGGVDFAQE